MEVVAGGPPPPPPPGPPRVELGSISSRRSHNKFIAVVVNAPPEGAAVHAYPLPTLPNSEYLVEEELEVVIKQPGASADAG
uniref:Uncharacterized protein n=1 Tax=Oryza brachyantha TaxID=4533 RepID=J3LPT8_ORYBR